MVEFGQLQGNKIIVFFLYDKIVGFSCTFL